MKYSQDTDAFGCCGLIVSIIIAVIMVKLLIGVATY